MLFADKLLSVLPAPSRSKIERMDADREAAHAAVRAASDNLQEARRDHALSESRARERLAMPRGIGVDVHPAAAVVNELTRQQEHDGTEARLLAPVQALKRRLDAARAAHERAVAAWSAFAFLEDVAAWLERVGPAQFQHVATPAPKASKGFAAEVERIRKELAGLDEAWRTAESAPAPKSDLVARAIAEIDALAERGKPDINARSRGSDPLRLAQQIWVGAVMTGASENRNVSLVGDAGAGLFMWAIRDQLVDKFTGLIEALPDVGALTDDAREQRLSEISAKRLEMERLEEAAIVAAEQQGQVIARRREIDPRALLEVIEA